MHWAQSRDWQDEVPDKRLSGCVVIEHKAPRGGPVQRGEWRRLKPSFLMRILQLFGMRAPLDPNTTIR